MSQIYRIRKYKEDDSKNIFYFLSNILTNEFNITLDFDNLDSDLWDIVNHYCKDDGERFWIVELNEKNNDFFTGSKHQTSISDFAFSKAIK